LTCTLLFALVACTTPAQRPSTPAPTTAPVPATPPAKPPAVPATAQPKGPIVLGSHGYEEAKQKIKVALAKNPADALPPEEVGYYVDVLQGRLKQVASKQVGVVVGRQGNDVILDLSSRLDFESGSARVTSGIAETLAPIVKVLAEYKMMLVAVDASPIDNGDAPVDARLSEQRGLGVARHLASAGVSPARIVVAGSSAGRTADGKTVATDARTHLEIHLEPIVRSAVRATPPR
jgi:outer membrane protein OmpA-like peptidoglycan-associated protein